MGIKYSVNQISISDANRILQLHESWILDMKGKDIKPTKLSKTISAFSNSNGGEVYLGISHRAEKEDYIWDGFYSEESFNSFISVIDNMMPTYEDFAIEVLKCEQNESMVVHITIHKTETIIYSSDSKAYIRHGVQNLPCDTDEKILRLIMDKGVASYEDEYTQCVFDEIKSSRVLTSFINQVVPQTSNYEWLRSQRIMNDSAKLSVAGVLLYDECPQSIIPKQSAVRILRYHTDETEGTRDTLEEAFPISIEGDIYTLIKNTVEAVRNIVETTSVIGTTGIEAKKYPEVALHEIIANAILHRDYSIRKDIQVRIYTNRIEIESPGKLPGHITLKNILNEQLARNPKVVRLISKFPSPPNKDVGEGLNTAFSAMMKMHLQRPIIEETESSVIVTIKHERLADAETLVIDYLSTHRTICNLIARNITGINDTNKMKKVFYRLRDSGSIRIVDGTKGSATLWEGVDNTMSSPATTQGEQLTLF